ncbi:MAG: DUF1553 domain-containing protein, partial [Planctomycetaceae bacterium]|nr:DUF1553 domain-containing protein [Planctomycetaceae bacterium]
QLAKDIDKGLTAAYVAFESGNIRSYRPGSFSEFVSGHFSLPAADDADAIDVDTISLKSFQVELVVQQSKDQCLLTVRQNARETVVVDRIPVALNGWNPVLHPEQGIYFDARPGSHVVIDDLRFLAADSDTSLLQFDFEAPEYSDGAEVVGIEGWEASSLGSAGTSLVSTAIGNAELQELAGKLRVNRVNVDALQHREDALRLQMAAQELHLSSLEKRHQAERRLQSLTSPAGSDTPVADEATKAICAEALQLHHQAAVAMARAEIASVKQQLAQAATEPDTSDGKTKEPVAELNQQLSSANVRLASAEAAAEKITAYSDLPPLGRVYPNQSTGRRAALAAWIASPDNPLTARVAVNHIWMRHFHAPLVSTVFDFGRNGSPPSHPELLDWLASELVDAEWSMKHLHRLILTSDAWQQSSAATPEGLSIDPENHLLWRMNRSRMEAEVLRDSLLHCADRLDLTMGGQELENSDTLTTFRRSIYYSCHPEADGRSEFGGLFDAPSPGDCYRRTQTVIPQQALALTNNQLIHELSERIADSMLAMNQQEVGHSDDEVTENAFQRILCRGPLPKERQACATFLSTEGMTTNADDPVQARRQRLAGLVRVLLNHNDFVTIR